MPKLNGKGPEGDGQTSGRRLGNCNAHDKKSLLENLGKGMGLKRKSGGGIGRKRRLKSGNQL